MSTTASEQGPSKHLNARQAAFIGVGAMVGAGIFSLLGAAGEVAGAAVWLSFLLAGAIAGLQGYSFAKFGARYPSAGGLLEYFARGFGNGHVTGIVAWLLLMANAIVTAMVAVSFGSYASGAVASGSTAWLKTFAVTLVVAMSILNIIGSQAVARVQTLIVVVVIGILAVFAVVTLANIHRHLLAVSGYPPLRDIVSAVALTFFAFLGFGIITFTAKDLADPQRELPRAMYLALGIATVIYVAVALGVFGTLTVEQVIESGGTAIAVAAEPVLGRAGYWLMTVTALFATTGATNAGLYPAGGLCTQMAATDQMPQAMGAKVLRRAPTGLVVTAVIAIVLAAFFDLSSIASIGSAVALMVFGLATAAHIRVRRETGAHALVLVLGVASTAAVLVVFILTTLVHEPTTMVTLALTIVGSIVLDFGWKRRRKSQAQPSSQTRAKTQQQGTIATNVLNDVERGDRLR
jgi:amino acid transporter